MIGFRQGLSRVVVPLLFVIPLSGQRAAFDEREVKAVFLFNFVQFVEWPSTAFDDPASPIVIGVLGEDPFGALLDEVVKGEVVKDRELTVVRFRRVEDIKTCHVLFISSSESRNVERILATLRAQPTLTVGESAGFTRSGMVRFVTEQSRVRLEVNVAAVKAAGLTISSNLLRSARLVGAAGN